MSLKSIVNGATGLMKKTSGVIAKPVVYKVISPLVFSIVLAFGGGKAVAADKITVPFDNPNQITMEQENDTKKGYELYLSGKGEASSDSYKLITSGRSLLTSDDDRIGIDLSLGCASEKNLIAMQTKIETFVAKYFKGNTNFYAQFGVGYESNNLSDDKIKLNLDERIFGIKGKVGVFNDDFMGDITASLDLGDYDLKLENIKKSGNVTGTNISANFRLFLDGPLDFEAGANLSYKVLENLWTALTFELGAGIVYEDSPLAVQLAAYMRHEELITNGNSDSETNFGLQVNGIYRASKNVDIYAGICGDTDKGFQLAFGVNFKFK